MAQRNTTTRVDDLDGAELGATGETVRFGFQGRGYEIDLSASNAAVLREVLRPFVEAGRKVPKPRGKKRR